MMLLRRMSMSRNLIEKIRKDMATLLYSMDEGHACSIRSGMYSLAIPGEPHADDDRRSDDSTRPDFQADGQPQPKAPDARADRDVQPRRISQAVSDLRSGRSARESPLLRQPAGTAQGV